MKAFKVARSSYINALALTYAFALTVAPTLIPTPNYDDSKKDDEDDENDDTFLTNGPCLVYDDMIFVFYKLSPSFPSPSSLSLPFTYPYY